jgi:hypothetical protein
VFVCLAHVRVCVHAPTHASCVRRLAMWRGLSPCDEPATRPCALLLVARCCDAGCRSCGAAPSRRTRAHAFFLQKALASFPDRSEIGHNTNIWAAKGAGLAPERLMLSGAAPWLNGRGD